MTAHGLSSVLAVLRTLSDGQFHGAQALAQQHGLSRYRLQQIRADWSAQSIDIQGVRGRGYRLRNPPEWLNAADIRRDLADAAGIFNIELADCVTSSNAVLLARAAAGAPGGTVLAVEQQTAGRGRQGRVWHASLGDSLTFSVLWRFACGPMGLSGLSLAVGVALMRAFERLGIRGASLKWPNDVIGGQGKMAGILIETQGVTAHSCAAVIGIGINLRVSPLSESVGQPVGALAQLTDELPARNRILAVCLRELATLLGDFSNGGFAPLRAEWEKWHGWQQQTVNVHLPDGRQVVGRAVGITDEGALCLETAEEMQTFHAGEVSVRLSA